MTLACLFLALSLSTVGAAEIQTWQEYKWPDEAGIRWRFQEGDLLVSFSVFPRAGPAGLCAADGVVLGMSLPWLRCGPLLARGILRLASDPLGFSAWSGVFQERTTLVLDGELSSSKEGVLLMPIPDLCGVFCRPVRTGGNEFGAFGSVPLAAGVAAEGAILGSRPAPQAVPEEWFLARSSFPGGDVMDVCARLVVSSPSLGISFASGTSSAQWAAPGAFSNLWISGRFPALQAAVLLAGATPGYRAPDGACASAATRLSAMVRLGYDRRTGALEVDWSFTGARPSFSPQPEIPMGTTVRAVLSRDFERPSFPQLSLVVEGEKDISRGSNGVRSEASRCGTTACAGFEGMDVTAGVSLSGQEGARVLGALSLKPSSRLRILAAAGANRLAAASPVGSMSMKVSFERGEQRAAVQTGFEDFPLASKDGGFAKHFRLSLSCTIRRVIPSLPPG